MSTITVGSFTYDPQTSAVEGPADYMTERYDAFMQDLLAGRAAAFYGAPSGTDPMLAALVAIQTDYAGWSGTRDLLRGLRRRSA